MRNASTRRVQEQLDVHVRRASVGHAFINSAFASKLLAVFAIFLVFLFSLVSFGPEAFAAVIERIRVEGNRKIENQAILEKISSKTGQPLSKKAVKQDIKDLHSLGYFDSISVDFTKSTLRYTVKERPLIARILFTGNDEIDTEDLKDVLSIKAYSLYDENLVRESVRKLTKFYEDKGYYLAKVTHEVRKDPKAKDSVDLSFKIKEFDKVRVKRITFLGNSVFSDSQLKRLLRGTSEYSFFSWLSNGGNFKELDFKTDMQLLQYWYLNEGYVRFRHDPPIVTVSEDKRWVYITIRVYEGDKYFMGDIDFGGDLLFPKEELSSMLQLKVGDSFVILKRNQDVIALTEKYQDLGYANVNVIPQMEIDDEQKIVDTTYEFQKGSLVHYNRITVKGNTKTRDKVIRRELRIKEGELYSGIGMRISKENVERLGFFEPSSVEFVTNAVAGRPDLMDVEISLKERPTGQFQLGAGYGTASKFFFTTQVAETNFRGMGQDLRLTGQFSADKRTRSFTLGFTDPYAFDTRWSAGGDIFWTSTPYPGRFQQYRKGFELRVGYPIWDYTRLFFAYKLQEFHHEEIRDLFFKKDSVVNHENGVSSSVTSTLLTDRRNNRMEPSAGWYFSRKLEFAGLGGNRRFLRAIVDFRYYYSLIGDLVLRTKVEAGNIFDYDGEGVQSAERFFLGGPNSLKGYRAFSVGPERSTPDPDDNVLVTEVHGGLNKILYILEFEYPIVKEVGLKLVAFYDVGEAFIDGKVDHFRLHQSYGLGVRWFSPFGPLRFEWGYPISPAGGVRDSNFEFMIGPPF